ncbi:MAG: hypothetical protein WHT06_14740 [Desulfobacterales bacterium]
MKGNVKAGFLVSYDWDLLRYSLPAVYLDVDRIFVSFDSKGCTWSGNRFFFDRVEFSKFINRLDHQNKIVFHQGDFFDPLKSPMENETWQRNQLASFMGPVGWHLQLDADEYILNCKDFIAYLSRIPVIKDTPFTVFASWIPIIKQAPEGFYLVRFPKGRYESFPLAFQNPRFSVARRTGFQNRLSGCLVFHQTLARSPEEVKRKLMNWGHAADFDGEALYRTWQSITHKNYREFKNFHPVVPRLWPELELVPVATIPELMATYRPPPVSAFRRFKVRLLSILLQGRDGFIPSSRWISRYFRN